MSHYTSVEKDGVGEIWVDDKLMSVIVAMLLQLVNSVYTIVYYFIY